MRSSSYRGARASLPTATPSTISAWIENGGSASDRPLAFHGRLLLGAACEDRGIRVRGHHQEPDDAERQQCGSVARELVVDRGAPSRDQARPCDHPTKGGKSREAE